MVFKEEEEDFKEDLTIVTKKNGMEKIMKVGIMREKMSGMKIVHGKKNLKMISMSKENGVLEVRESLPEIILSEEGRKIMINLEDLFFIKKQMGT